MTTWWPRASARKRKSGKARSWFGSFGRIQFAAPGQAVDVDTQRVLAQALLRARGLQDDRHHGVPAFGARGRAIDEPLFCPAEVERGIAGARAAGDLRSEERRVGKECVITCNYRGWP